MDQRSIIEDLDARQNEVLAALDQLNQPIETLLNECVAARDQAAQAAEK